VGAEEVADFYRGKTITLSVGYSSGGAYDGVARILARYMRAYIPGNPTIIVKNAPGAGTLSLTNQLYNVAVRDGTQFGIIARGMAMEPLIGQSNTKFDSTKFTWIGSAASEVSMCATYESSVVKTWEDALIKPIIVAGNGSRLAGLIVLTALLVAAGFASPRHWTDPQGWFAVFSADAR
jgi:tripartite-type tricarboxylate transporter receptor subunit TctC